jgi:hypothetical protein
LPDLQSEDVERRYGMSDGVAYNPCSACKKDDLCNICELYLYRSGAISVDKWISVDERLPEEGKCVIVWVGSVQVARIEKGITEEERQKMKNGEVEDKIEYSWSQSTGCMPLKRSNLYKACDVHGNNRVPYCWKANGGPMEWFGQNVTHWMPLPEPPKMKGGAE